MLINTLKPFFRRDILKLRQELASYQDERNIWLVDKGITNSAGNLCLHLLGNLNDFIGAKLGSSGYVRQRELEFTLRDISREELLKRIDDTLSVVESTLDQLKEEQLEGEFPVRIADQKLTNESLLVHVITHLHYHLGQINYHRRLLDHGNL